ncbi:MAG: 3D domain-containing protein [Algisphaera sp.]
MTFDQANGKSMDAQASAAEQTRGPLEAVRRTRRHAWILASVIGCVAVVVAGVIVNAMVHGLRGGGESMELMSLVPVVNTVDVAPSRPAPSFIPPPTAAEMVQIEEALVAATQDAGPDLGTEVALSLATAPMIAADAPTFDGRPLRAVKTLRMLTTAYSPDARSCGKWADGVTASGYSVWTNGMKLVAADTKLLPFGTIISIPGYHGGKPVPVLDRGGRIKGSRLDLLYPTHEIALKWGAQRLDVTVWEYADE